VAFWSNASNLVPGDTNVLADVFVHDLETGETTQAGLGVSLASPSLSRDGRFLAFDNVRHDRLTGHTEQLEVGGIPIQGRQTTLSPDGASFSFDTGETFLVGDTEGSCQLQRGSCGSDAEFPPPEWGSRLDRLLR
jgi:hypothetical protein